MARPKGSKGKATSDLRMVVAAFVDANACKFEEWLNEIRINEGPLEAFKRVESLLEYCLPKLARNEHTGKDGKDLNLGNVNAEAIILNTKHND